MLQATHIQNIPSAKLAEGPVWDYRSNTLWWVDILNGKLHSYHLESATQKTNELGQYLGAAIPCKDSANDLIVAIYDGIALYNTVTGKIELLSNPEKELPKNRFNDGKCDPKGRFWVGTMEIEPQNPKGSLYCFSKGVATKKLENIYISNGLAWSLDCTKMYYIDTLTHKLQMFDYDLESGSILNGKDAIVFDKSLGYPDGMTIDENGNLWICFYGGSKVCCFNPTTGKEVTRISVPTQCPTSCAFGGADMNTLFITSAAKKDDTLGGSMFSINLNVKGIKTNFYQ